jgi:hypothetical protein
MLISKKHSWRISEFQNFTIVTFITDNLVIPEPRATREDMTFSPDIAAIVYCIVHNSMAFLIFQQTVYYQCESYCHVVLIEMQWNSHSSNLRIAIPSFSTSSMMELLHTYRINSQIRFCS